MTTILAAIDDTPAADPVLRAAISMSSLLDATVVAFHVREDAKATAAGVAARAGVALQEVDGDPTARIIEAVADPDVVLVAIGARSEPGGRRPGGHVALAVAGQCHKPVLVVPPDAPPPDGPPRRALLPLEGTLATAEAVATTLRDLTSAGVEIVALHVFTPDTVPRFWDEEAHAEQSWASEFAARWCQDAEVDVHLRSGAPAETVVDVAQEQHADLVALGWRQDLAEGRASVVRAALNRCRMPVLLVPIEESPVGVGTRAGT